MTAPDTSRRDLCSQLLDDVTEIVHQHESGLITDHELLQVHYLRATRRLADWIPEDPR